MSETNAAAGLQQAGFQKQDAANVQLLVTRIKKDFPAAETGVIRDILHGSVPSVIHTSFPPSIYKFIIHI